MIVSGWTCSACKIASAWCSYIYGSSYKSLAHTKGCKPHAFCQCTVYTTQLWSCAQNQSLGLARITSSIVISIVFAWGTNRSIGPEIDRCALKLEQMLGYLQVISVEVHGTPPISGLLSYADNMSEMWICIFNTYDTLQHPHCSHSAGDHFLLIKLNIGKPA